MAFDDAPGFELWLTLQRSRQLTRLEPIHELNLMNVARTRHEIEDGPFDNQVI